jgi:hypothetical protein
MTMAYGRQIPLLLFLLNSNKANLAAKLCMSNVLVRDL